METISLARLLIEPIRAKIAVARSNDNFAGTLELFERASEINQGTFEQLATSVFRVVGWPRLRLPNDCVEI